MGTRNTGGSNHRTAIVVVLIIVVTVLAVGAIRYAAASDKATPAPDRTAGRQSDGNTISTTKPVPSATAGSSRLSATMPATASNTEPATIASDGPGSPSPSPQPISTRPHPALTTYKEQEWHTGANTFGDPNNASEMGPKIAPGQYVRVSCKLYDPSIPSASPGGYWYRIASPPWNNKYYAVANTFLNGDPWGGPYTHPTDLKVRNC
jgi:hypothetical protein